MNVAMEEIATAYVSPAAILVCSETHFALLHFGNFVRQCEFCFGGGNDLFDRYAGTSF